MKKFNFKKEDLIEQEYLYEDDKYITNGFIMLKKKYVRNNKNIEKKYFKEFKGTALHEIFRFQIKQNDIICKFNQKENISTLKTESSILYFKTKDINNISKITENIIFKKPEFNSIINIYNGTEFIGLIAPISIGI